MADQMKIIAHIRSDFTTKFGIPRQSGLVDSLKSVIVFEPEYRVPEAFRGLEGYSHIWLIWKFSEAVREEWSPTVRPPRLGGNTRMGVFATRSPYRPNPVGLSSVKLERIELDSSEGPVLHVSGADLMDGTPIYDIKPYLPYVDCHTDATGGFALQQKEGVIAVNCPEELLAKIPADKQQPLIDLLAQDPRPAYQSDPERVYGMEYAGFEVKFKADELTLTVTEIAEI